MGQEIELKLALNPAAVEQLADHSHLTSLSFTRFPLGNTYFDTSQGHLEKARMALRLRRTQDGWLQTLKTAGQESGGLSRRGEWEWPVAPHQLDLTGLASLLPFEAWTPYVLNALVPRFSTDFQRTRWLIEREDSVIEVALDRGEIRAGQRRAPICELELELKRGQADALWSLAEDFAEHLPLRPATLSKAARGGALLNGHWLLPKETDSHLELWRRTLVALDAEADSGDPAFRKIASQALERLGYLGHMCNNVQLARLAQRLAKALARDDDSRALSWLDATFGQLALALSRRLMDRN